MLFSSSRLGDRGECRRWFALCLDGLLVPGSDSGGDACLIGGGIVLVVALGIVLACGDTSFVVVKCEFSGRRRGRSLIGRDNLKTLTGIAKFVYPTRIVQL